MILTGVVLAVLVGLLRGGRLERLGDLKLQAFPLVWAAILLRLAAGALIDRGFAFGPSLQVLAYVLFMYVMLANARLVGLKTFGLGSFLNFMAIAANGGRMPVSAAASARAGIAGEPIGIHTLLTEQSRLWFLTDIIPVPLHLPVPSVISIGDIFIVLGMFFFIQHRMLHTAKNSQDN